MGTGRATGDECVRITPEVFSREAKLAAPAQDGLRVIKHPPDRIFRFPSLAYIPEIHEKLFDHPDIAFQPVVVLPGKLIPESRDSLQDIAEMPEKIVTMVLSGFPEPRPRDRLRLFKAFSVIHESAGFPIVEIPPFIGEFQAGDLVGVMLDFF